MSRGIAYSIPVKGLKEGDHRFEFSIDQSFFQDFEHSPIANGSIQMELELEKKPSLYVLNFQFSGTVKTECDRCLATIDLPVAGKERMLVKVVANPGESTDPEVMYLAPDAERLELATIMYEFVILAIPLIKVYDCEADENRVCNEEMLDLLDPIEPEDDTSAPEENPIWAELKKLNKNNN